jgi:cellobiose-specific phosphotransferase system component IIA
LLDPKEEESIFEHYMAMMDKANKETKAEAERKWQESKREFTREAHRYQWQHIFATEIRVKKGK